jgi:predicted nucleotidyltransferase
MVEDEMTDIERSIAFDNEILRGIVGSTALGTAVEGEDDRDEMGVSIEPIEYVCGLSTFEHYIFRTQPEGVRSGSGDLDLTIYSLRKFCRLATQGNPSILVLLWLPDYTILTQKGIRLINIRDSFISKNAGERFLGYLSSQRRALTGEKTKKVSRPDFVEKYGYDTKFAMHALRLGLQGITYLTEHRIELPIPEPNLSTLRAIRNGEIRLSDVLQLINETETKLRTLVDDFTLNPDIDRINQFLVDAHHDHWHPS